MHPYAKARAGVLALSVRVRQLGDCFNVLDTPITDMDRVEALEASGAPVVRVRRRPSIHTLRVNATHPGGLPSCLHPHLIAPAFFLSFILSFCLFSSFFPPHLIVRPPLLPSFPPSSSSSDQPPPFHSPTASLH
jgi:hypothetical protein